MSYFLLIFITYLLKDVQQIFSHIASPVFSIQEYKTKYWGLTIILLIGFNDTPSTPCLVISQPFSLPTRHIRTRSKDKVCIRQNMYILIFSTRLCSCLIYNIYSYQSSYSLSHFSICFWFSCFMGRTVNSFYVWNMLNEYTCLPQHVFLLIDKEKS